MNNNMKSSLPFIIIAICIGLYFLYISPTITDVQALRDQKAEYTNVLEKVQEIKEMRDAVSATYNNIPSADLNRLSKIVPERFNSTLLANDLNNLASKVLRKALPIQAAGRLWQVRKIRLIKPTLLPSV